MAKPNYKIFGEVKGIQSDYETGRVEIVDGLYYSMYKTLKMCYFYTNSTYLGNPTLGVANTLSNLSIGKNKDMMGRDKPFYNIVNYRVDLAKTATDLDIKDIQIVSDNPAHYVKAMLLNKEAYKWMKEADFSAVLNDMGRTRPQFGGYLIKKCNGEDGLEIEVVEWKNIACNQLNILGNPIVETHYMSPVEMKSKDNVWKNVTEVLKASRKDNKGKSSNITVYEVTGEFPISLYKDAKGESFSDEDEYTFSLQKYFIADVGGKDYMLFCDELSGEMEDYYRYLSWGGSFEKRLGRGVIEESEEAQVWTNDAVINEKNAMDLAGKVVMKTTSKKLANNILEVDNGKIFDLNANETLESVNLSPTALGEFQNQIEKWRLQADNATSSYNAITGEQPPSGTPYSQTALLNQVATKPFDYKREEWGIHLTEVFEDWVIPYLIKKLYKDHVLVSDFSDDELNMIDETFAVKNTNEALKNMVLAGQYPTPQDQEKITNDYKNHIKGFGAKRFIEIPKGYFDDIEANVTVITSGEQKNKAAILQSLSTIMGDITRSFNPQTGKFAALEDPKMSKIFGTILELSGSGITPTSLGIGMNMKETTATPVQSPMAPLPTPAPVTA